MNQTVMPFGLTTVEEYLTAHADLGLFGEFASAMKLSDQRNRRLPKPGSAKSFIPGVYVQSLPSYNLFALFKAYVLATE